MRQGVNRLALPYFFTSASPAKFLAYNLGLLTRANPKKLRPRTGEGAVLTALLLRNQSHHLGFAKANRFSRSRSLD
jgi:hypothetical protein